MVGFDFDRFGRGAFECFYYFDFRREGWGTEWMVSGSCEIGHLLHFTHEDLVGLGDVFGVSVGRPRDRLFAGEGREGEEKGENHGTETVLPAAGFRTWIMPRRGSFNAYGH